MQTMKMIKENFDSGDIELAESGLYHQAQTIYRRRFGPNVDQPSEALSTVEVPDSALCACGILRVVILRNANGALARYNWNGSALGYASEDRYAGQILWTA